MPCRWIDPASCSIPSSVNSLRGCPGSGTIRSISMWPASRLRVRPSSGLPAAGGGTTGSCGAALAGRTPRLTTAVLSSWSMSLFPAAMLAYFSHPVFDVEELPGLLPDDLRPPEQLAGYLLDGLG